MLHEYLIKGWARPTAQKHKSTKNIEDAIRKIRDKAQGLNKAKHERRNNKNKEDLTQNEINQVQISEAKKKYNSYKKSNKWKEKTKEFIKSKYWGECKACGCTTKDSTKPLEIHHKTYERLGQEKLTDLVCLCSNCHTAVHELVTYKRQNKGKIHEKNIGLSLKNAHMKLKNALDRIGTKEANKGREEIIRVWLK